ncbi:MAG: serine hydrolase domain-containing protein [Pseudomonadota bacterium]
MRFRTLAATAALTLATALPAGAFEQLDAVLAKAMEGSKVPAAGVLVMRNGQVEDQAVRGLRRNDGKDAVLPDDAWVIGSTGKVMTVAMVMRLVEHGSLSWDTPLEQLLPELAKAMRPEYRKVTLVELLSHRAGLPRDLRNTRALDAYFTDKRELGVQRLAYIAAALKEKPEVKPGTAFSYSNTGFLIAAAVAEKVSGKSYEALMQAEVFAPLGMQTAGSGTTHDGQIRGHSQGKPKLVMKKESDGVPAMYAPAGFLHMSLGDWAKFSLDQLAGARGEGKLLAPASYKLMQTAQPGSGAGLDWGVQPGIAGRKGPVLVHQGSDGNWLAVVVLFPEQGTGVLAVANAADDMGADKVIHAMIGPLFSTLAPAK